MEQTRHVQRQKSRLHFVIPLCFSRALQLFTATCVYSTILSYCMLGELFVSNVLGACIALCFPQIRKSRDSVESWMVGPVREFTARRDDDAHCLIRGSGSQEKQSFCSFLLLLFVGLSPNMKWKRQLGYSLMVHNVNNAKKIFDTRKKSSTSRHEFTPFPPC